MISSIPKPEDKIMCGYLMCRPSTRRHPPPSAGPTSPTLELSPPPADVQQHAQPSITDLQGASQNAACYRQWILRLLFCFLSHSPPPAFVSLWSCPSSKCGREWPPRPWWASPALSQTPWCRRWPPWSRAAGNPEEWLEDGRTVRQTKQERSSMSASTPNPKHTHTHAIAHEIYILYII